MRDTERAMLEALQDYYEAYLGMMAGAVSKSYVDAKLRPLNKACGEHMNENDGRFTISED